MKFSKMQANGNDFIIVDARKIKLDWSDLAKKMCDRHFGIGGDGLILLYDDKQSNLYMRIFNADGSEAEMCGNGIRCFALYAQDNFIECETAMKIHTLAGVKFIRISRVKNGKNLVRVNMGSPKFNHEDIPVNIELEPKNKLDIMYELDYRVKIGREIIPLSFVSMGNPHAVTFIKTPVSKYPLEDIGARVEQNKIFPERTNFEVARLLKGNKIEARVWERGVGETLACGTGACAIGVIAKLKHFYDKKVDIIMPGGSLKVEWGGDGDVFLTGGAEKVFNGDWQP